MHVEELSMRKVYVQKCIMWSLSLHVYQVRLDWLPLPCIALVRPSQLSCLGSCVCRASAS